MEFDARLLRPAGGFGRRARLLAAATWVPNAALALGFFAGLLLAAPPAHRCRPDPALLPPALRNLSGRALLNVSVPRGPAGWSRCLLYRYAPGAAGPNRTGPCTRGWDYEVPAVGLRSSLVTQWDLVCSNRWKVPLEQTTYLLGWLSGCIVLGLACDRFGRRATFVFSLVLAVPLGIGVALALNYMMLLSLRLLLGAVLAGTFLSLYVARLELCDPPHRLMVVMVAGFFWVAGELLLPGLAVLCRQWRLLQGAVTLTLAVLATCWGCPSLFPESPRWLLATRQLEKGRKGLRALAEGNGVSLEDEFYSQEHLLADLLDWIILILSVLGIAYSQAVTMLSIFFASEVLPTVVRGAGLGLIMAASFVGKAAGPIMDIQNNRGFFLHHVVFASFAILSVLSIMLLPESKGRGLPESLHDGESQRRPPLFRSSRRRDQLPLLSPQSAGHASEAQDYAHLVTATKKMLSSHRRTPPRDRQLLLEPTPGGDPQQEI
ncbi:putative solute carrier family 22 member 31 isoform X2 [Gopherus evgoodei]|uniref:putative solute carrier family 22 member 31 isoform X2 n=1 Tax=Gopherus evgoodei TaxID=1825980 RepID=UPI0011CF343B|nr:putative solute carrier family 22 member 31 isoform X2 [Gopherus evgoodei]